MMHWGSKLKMQELGSAIYRVSKKYISSFNLGAHCGVGVCTILLLATTFTVRASTGQANAATNITSAAPPQISTTASNKNIATVDGNALLTTGNFEQAVAYWRAVAKAKRQQGDAAAEAIALFNLAAAQRALGMQTRAIRALNRAWQLSKHLDEPQLQVNILSSLAGAYLYAGRIDKAKTLFIDARAKAMLIKDMRLEALILNDQGNLYAFEKSYDKALQAYQSSILLAQKIEENMLVARAQTNAALVSLQRRWPLQTKQYVLFAFDRLSSLPNSYEKAYAQIKLAEITSKLLNLSVVDQKEVALIAINALNETLQLATELNNARLASHSLGLLGGIYEIADKHTEALQYTEKAIFYAQKADAADLIYQWEWQAGRLYNTMGNIDNAIRFYRFSVNSLQPLRHDLTRKNFGDQASFKETQGGVYLELADLLLQKSAAVDSQKRISEYLLEARDTVELQKEAELQDYFKDSCVINAKNRVTAIDENISPDTAVIYPIMLPDRTEMLVSYASGIQRYTIEKTEAQVTEQVRALRVKLEMRKTREYLPYAKTLHQWLIKPMEKDFNARGITTLVVVADQALRTIPLSVLHDGEDFLINKYALASTPGLKLTDPGPLNRENINVLLSGLSQPVQGFPALQHVQGELETIQDLYVGKLLLNRDFVTSSISNALQDTNYTVTHIASHSVFTGDVNDSYILTYDDRITVDQLGQFAALSRNREKPIELLTLSSCQTAAGDDRAALGLAGVAVKSGARSALATLWAINDQASAMLVTEFYQQLLNENTTKAQALQRAQTKLMGNVRYRHPGYWSPFLLIGNWL